MVIRRKFKHTFPTQGGGGAIATNSIDLTPYKDYVNSLTLVSVSASGEAVTYDNKSVDAAASGSIKIGTLVVNSSNKEGIEDAIKECISKSNPSHLLTSGTATGGKAGGYNITLVLEFTISDEEYLAKSNAFIKQTSGAKQLINGWIMTNNEAKKIKKGWIMTTNGAQQIYSENGGMSLEDMAKDSNSILKIKNETKEEEWIVVGDAETESSPYRNVEVVNKIVTGISATKPKGIILIRKNPSSGNVPWHEAQSKNDTDCDFFLSSLFSRMTDTFFNLDIGINKLAIPVAFSGNNEPSKYATVTNGGLENCCYCFVLKSSEIDSVREKLIISGQQGFWTRDKGHYGPDNTDSQYYFHPCICLDKKTAVKKIGDHTYVLPYQTT